MEFFVFIIVITAISCGAGVINSWIKHRTEVARLRLSRGPGDDGSVRADLEALRQEVRALRDSSTQYDLSFDTALQRLETRVTSVERQIAGSRADTPAIAQDR